MGRKSVGANALQQRREGRNDRADMAQVGSIAKQSHRGLAGRGRAADRAVEQFDDVTSTKHDGEDGDENG